MRAIINRKNIMQTMGQPGKIIGYSMK